ncbi:hypothetical protein [Streptomyces lushanensis]|uniref:hypothetical protein n=1 Tax=Streptomyces lushanensis TaxID=1434255 RepID=UPI00082C5F71|nr:hypothetical protein [Streptomyces lushanensis]
MRARATRFTGELLVMLVIVVVVTVFSTWGDETADPAACRASLTKDLDKAMTEGGDVGFPAACENVDSTAYERLVDEVYDEKAREIDAVYDAKLREIKEKYEERLKELVPPTPPTTP